jgi:hypothetical protein
VKFLYYCIIEKATLCRHNLEDNKIEEILSRAVSLFKKTGLDELAEKWDRILRTYMSRKLLI